MQSSKFIDVKRSYIPVNVNTFPENMHATDKEDSPEKRAPVVPYDGYNFMPTGHGYRSYFGVNEAVDVSSLSPNKVNEVLLFQTANYRNVLIALCDTGIWAVDGSTADGEWEQILVKAAPDEDEFFEYTYLVINNKLYVYRSNDTAFYKIDTDIAEDLNISIDELIPTFITPTAQLGMFRLGARIGFWDGANAIAWSSPDDYTDFTPAVLTGANVMTFNSVIGQISAIRPHGKGAIVYSTKSIVFLAVEPSETFLVKAVPIINNAGVAYLRQSVDCVPDTLHFCYTNVGIYKIESGQEELIVPEFWDYCQEFSGNPVYLKLLQGRHLFFEIMDANVLAGEAQFTTGVIPASTLTFPGSDSSLEDINASDVEDVDICDITGLLSGGYFDEQREDGDAAVPPAQRKPGTVMQPIYTCYLSNNGVRNADDITFDATPCGFTGPDGTPFTMSPILPVLDDLTITSANKTTSNGLNAYIDGKWTMQRFVQTQSAIWAAEEKALAATIAKIKSRVFFEQKVTNGAAACAVDGPDETDCPIGRFPASFSPYQFGWNKCSFWLTRYALTAEDIVARHTTSVACATEPENLSTWSAGGNTCTATTGGYASAAAALAYLASQHVGTNPYLGAVEGTSPGGNVLVYDVVSDSHPLLDCKVSRTVLAATYTKTETGSAANIGTPAVISPTPETAYCELTHWKYTAPDGVETLIAAAACTTTSDKYPSSTTTTRQVPLEDERPNYTGTIGDFCGAPFEYNTEFDVEWPEQSITYPALNFLLQEGSIAPKYPTMQGAFVYDLHLKKWGKMQGEYKQLLDYSPLNNNSSNVIDFQIFGMLGGVVKADGFVYIFTDRPTDSRITWGKIGYYRAGMTDAQEVRVDFGRLSTGSVIVQASLDGKNLGDELLTEQEFLSANQVICYPEFSGKWFNVTVTGIYDISYLEFKGLIKGRR